MALLKDILQLSGEWPDWQSDALRRLFATGALQAQDLVDMRAMVEGKPGAPAAVRLAQAHVPHLGDGSSALLVELRNLQDVNGFSAGRGITFAATGLSVVFGENGAGKSGFARVLKRACRARRSTAVLGNVFEPKKGTPSGEVVVQDEHGAAAPHPWQEGSAAHAQLAMVAIYDSQCGNDYVTAEGPCDFQPFGLPYLGQLTQAMSKVQEQVIADRNAIVLDPAQFQALRGTHKVGEHIAKLGPATDLPALRDLAKLSEEETKRIGQIEQIQATLDVETPAKAAEALALRLDQASTRCKDIEKLTSDAAIARLHERAAAVEVAQEVDRTAQTLLRGEDEDALPGTGGAAWKLLFQAAKAFSIEAYPHAHTHPATENGTRCVLCQQDLAPTAQARLDAFRTYVMGEAATALATAISALGHGLHIVDAAKREVLDEATMGELREGHPETHALIEPAQKAWEGRQQWAKDAGTFRDWHCPRPAPAPNPLLSQIFSDKAMVLRDKAAELRASKDENQIRELATEHAGIVARHTLATVLPQVEQFVANAKRRKELDDSQAKLRTQALSTLITRLSSEHVSGALVTSLEKELAQLGARRLKPMLHTATRRGQSFIALTLDGSRAGPGDTLSEGEQRAMGLALFLAEAKLRGDRSTIVFDDPSTSLDHSFRERIAKRLVTLSQERPIVVFTHDAVFLTQLQMTLANAGQDAVFQTVEWEAGKPGAVRGGLAWENKSFAAQFQEIFDEAKAFAATANAQLNDAERRKMRDLHDRLRGALERGVREVILFGVVHPFMDEIKVARLGAIAGFSLEEWRQVMDLHDKCSSVLAGHDTNRDRQQEVPHPTDLLEDLKQAKLVFDGCVKRANDFKRDVLKPHMDKRSAPRGK